MSELTEYGDLMINAYVDEWGRRKIDGLLEDGTLVIIIFVPPPPVVEIIVANDFPMAYLESPVKAQQLTSKVSGATIQLVSQDYPLTMLKKDKAKELKSKWTPPS